MDSSRTEMCKSLIDWFKVLIKDDGKVKSDHLDNLNDGVAMARALNKLGPEFFTDSWLSKIKVDVGTNWRLKASNLKKVVESIFDYYAEVLNIPLNDFIRPDVMRIAEKNNQNELSRMLQLILGCAINCPMKLVYIKKIMELEESLQQNIMQAIQELETTFQGNLASKGGVGSLSISNFDARFLQEDRDRLAQKCHEADRQIALLHEEKQLLQQEMVRLQKEVDLYENPRGSNLIGDDGASLGPVQPGSTRYNDMRRQLEALKEELLQAEAQRDDFKIKSFHLESEVAVLKTKLDDHNQAQTELAQLKDELDALREANDKLKASEGLITTYKKKLEDYSDLKRQVKHLEDRNAEYLQQNLHQEEHVKKLSTLKGQVELYKKEIQELHTRLDSEINKTVKIEFELSTMNAQLMALQREKEALAAERDGLLDTCDQLRCNQGGGSGGIGDSNAISNELTLPALREKIRLLSDENKALREGQGGQTALAQMLEDSNQRAEKLREQLKAANQKILSLSAQSNPLDDNGKVTDANRSHHQKESLDGSDPKASQAENSRLQSKCAQLEAALSAREQEIALLDMKYRKYAEKAKEVIKNLDPRMINDSVQISEKNPSDSDNDLMVTSSPIRAPPMSQFEERLMATAYHNLATSCQRDAVDARLALINGGGQSFLSRQRQPPLRKPVTQPKRTK